MRLFFRHCAVLYLKGMAIDHLVISKLQHLLENSSNADVHGAMTLASIASQQKIRLIRCFAGQLISYTVGKTTEVSAECCRRLCTFLPGCSVQIAEM